MEHNIRAEKKSNLYSFSVSSLVETRRTALRRGVWFKVLNRIERGVVDLTMRYIDVIRSTKLAKVLTAILSKLKQATESILERKIRVLGRPMAQKISDIALSWGNHSASTWAKDLLFASYLANNFTKLCTETNFGVLDDCN